MTWSILEYFDSNILNDYFPNLAQNSKLSFAENLFNHSCDNPIFMVILKSQKHPSITAINEIHHISHFSFNDL